MSAYVDVSAAILVRPKENADITAKTRIDAAEEYLLASRPKNKVYAGFWEFPGGKREPGETWREALDREVREELGVVVQEAFPWLAIVHVYPHVTVRLKLFRVTRWEGDISPLEHQGFIWTTVGETPVVSPVLPANGPVLRALALPKHYAITNAAENGIQAELLRLKSAINKGLRLILLRDKTLPAADRLAFGRSLMTMTRAFPELIVMVSSDKDLAREIGADGVHLSSDQLMKCVRRPNFKRVSASCHNAGELVQAVFLTFDFVTLSPVLPTDSHLGAPNLGWARFAKLSGNRPLPTFALGGMTPDSLKTAMLSNAHGIAMMRGWE